jgi:Outer membrane protein beta-barrel domain
MRVICMGLLLAVFVEANAQNVEAFGVFGGLNVPITVDQGLQKDTRFVGRFTLRATPVGFTYGYDHVGFGFVLSPSYTQIGQQFIIRNTAGGDVGVRNVKMDYFSVPVALKLHVNDLAFFRLSIIAALNFNYLISGKETLTFSASKLKYPKSVAIPTDPGYVSTYDGVIVPNVKGLDYVTKDKFNPFQVFAGLGLRSDFDMNDDWSLNFDGRANFGLFDPRKKDYVEQLKQTSNAPDLYGPRREIYLSVMIGVSHIIQIKKEFKPKHSSSSITVRPKSLKHKKRRKH